MWTPFCAGSRSTKQSISAETSASGRRAASGRLLDAGDARAREPDPHLGGRGLQVCRAAVSLSSTAAKRSSLAPRCRTTAERRSPSSSPSPATTLRTPLATVYGFARTLDRLDPRGARRRATSEIIVAASEQIARARSTSSGSSRGSRRALQAHARGGGLARARRAPPRRGSSEERAPSRARARRCGSTASPRERALAQLVAGDCPPRRRTTPSRSHGARARARRSRR